MVHGKRDVSPSPDEMLDSLRPKVIGLVHDGQMQTWNNDALRLTYETLIISVRRLKPGDESYLWDRDNWENELRSWDGPNCEKVIQHLRHTCQTVTITPIATTTAGFPLGQAKLARVCEQLCGHVARETDGLIQVFQEGFFDVQGESLFPYSPKHRLKTK